MSQSVVDSAEFITALETQVRDSCRSGRSDVATVYDAIAYALTRYSNEFNGGLTIPVDVIRAVTSGVTIYTTGSHPIGGEIADTDRRRVWDRIETLIGLTLNTEGLRK